VLLAQAPHSLAYVLQADAFARNKATAVQKLAASNRDWIVLDAEFSASVPWKRADIDSIRSARPGRRMLCYLSIGEAEDYRAYWNDAWFQNGKPTAKAPSWLLSENPDWPGNYKVRYWDKNWQSLILPSVDSAMAAGFDGVYLDIVDAFEFFEQDGDRFIDNRINPETGKTYRNDMIGWVGRIAERARKANRAAMIVPQNGPQLLAHRNFLETISAIGIEDLFTDGIRLQAKADTDYVLSFLNHITAANKPVLLIEYPTAPERKSLVKTRARQHGFIWLVTDRGLKTLGASGS
jgi:cysteinyl-tRNA synthetase